VSYSKTIKGATVKLKVIIHEAQEGGYWGEVPAIPGCASQGETTEALLKNLREAIEGCLSIDIAKTGKSDRERILEIAV
jgi:predicted RNase H-like HicB family nuclease